jgi:predicted  nucleic acid-binding Zn-ribbon protein
VLCPHVHREGIVDGDADDLINALPLELSHLTQTKHTYLNNNIIDLNTNIFDLNNNIIDVNNNTNYLNNNTNDHTDNIDYLNNINYLINNIKDLNNKIVYLNNNINNLSNKIGCLNMTQLVKRAPPLNKKIPTAGTWHHQRISEYKIRC